MNPGEMGMRTKNLAVALAVGLPLMAVAYVGWVYYSARAEFAGGGLLNPPPEPYTPQPEQIAPLPPVEPTDLYGAWTVDAEVGTGENLNRRGAVLTFEPDGKLTWATRVTVGTAPPIEIVEKYEYTCGPAGPALTLMPIERSANGKRIELKGNARMPKFWQIKWGADDKTSFLLRSGPNDLWLPHLHFQRAKAGTEWRLLGWDLTRPARR